MSKIAEKKALEAYPIKEEWVGNQYGGLEDINSPSREKYQEGYDQAMKDFMEKACEWLRHNTMRELVLDSELTELVEDFVDDFKNYMEEGL